VPYEDEFVGMVCVESPDVRFEFVVDVKLNEYGVAAVPIDQIYKSICEPDTIQVVGWSTSKPILLGTVIANNTVYATASPRRGPVDVVLKLSGIRLGRKNQKFQRFTLDEMKKNTAFWNSWQEM
jgi:hypothetical protein